MVVVLDDAGQRGLHLHQPSLAEWMLARARSWTWDHQLAAGIPPETRPTLAIRADVLVRPDSRLALAQVLRHLQAKAFGPGGAPRSAQIPVHRAGILDAADALGDLIDRLVTPGPVSAHGVALASLLISDGHGPVYHPRYPGELRDRVLQAIDCLRVDQI